jgi:hypothetical protein
MKQTLIALSLLTTFHLVPAQERLPKDEALKYAAAVSADVKQLRGTPIPTDVDAARPVALRDGEYGGMVLPQKQLTAETLAKAGDAVLPIGQLWLHKLTPMLNGEAVAADKLRMVTVSADGTEASVPQCALGVRRNGSGGLELLVFGKGSQPVVTTPLKVIDTKQEAPIDMDAERDSDSGRMRLSILGKYQATLTVTELEP